MSNNHYEPEFKEKILRLYLEEGRTKKSLTEEFNLGQGIINYWLQQRRKECKQIRKYRKKITPMKIEIYHKNDGVPGYRMMHNYMNQCNITYTDITVYKYMKELGLRSIVRKKKPNYVKGNAKGIPQSFEPKPQDGFTE